MVPESRLVVQSFGYSVRANGNGVEFSMTGSDSSGGLYRLKWISKAEEAYDLALDLLKDLKGVGF